MLWFCKTEILWKTKIVFNGYRQFHIHNTYRYNTVYIKADDIFKDIAEDVETRFSTSNYELDRQLPKGKNEKVIWLMKYELGTKTMKKVIGSRTKTYNYLIDDSSEDKKAKGQKSVIKRKTNLKIIKTV